MREKNVLKGTLPKKLGEKLNAGYSRQFDEANEFN